MFALSWLPTPLGPTLALADEEALYLLEFAGYDLAKKVQRIRQKRAIVLGRSAPIDSIENELNAYFEGKSCSFKTPLFLPGSCFQKQVWKELQKIPPGETRSYSAIAASIGRPSACRAVAVGNRTNPFSIVIPCHRVIYADGSLGGYAGGLTRKEWLLNHERGTKRENAKPHFIS